MTNAIPAATLVLYRPGPAGPEHLFVERSATMAFAAGAVVFPGGRVDPGDYVLAEGFGALDPADAAGRIAAIRETIEEAGIAVGMIGDVDIEALRLALGRGEPFGALIDTNRLRLDLDGLVPFARWCPNFKETRTFDTRFYLARIDADHAIPRVDATENVHLFWATATDVLARADRGEVKIIYPTRRNLERLATFGDFEAAKAHSARYRPDKITPWIEERGGEQHLCIPDDRGYPVTAEILSSAMRA